MRRLPLSLMLTVCITLLAVPVLPIIARQGVVLDDQRAKEALTDDIAEPTVLRPRFLSYPSTNSLAEGLLFEDQFHGGSPDLAWKPYPHFNQDNLEGTLDLSSPGQESGIGVLTNANVGGFAALSYVDRTVPSDLAIETWLYTMVTSEKDGQLNGVALLVDPSGQRFYRVATEFAEEPILSLAYIGSDTSNFPVYLRTWGRDDIPGGIPTASGWHRLRIELMGGNAEVYWDNERLPGGPFALDRIDAGFVGVYANYVGGLGHAETRVDDFRVQPLPVGPDVAPLSLS